MLVEEKRARLQGEKPVSSVPVCSSTVLPSMNAWKEKHKSSTMVGFDERLEIVMDELTGHKCDLQILPIVGMGGIGKTILARNVFDNPYIVHHFDKRVWLTISQESRYLIVMDDVRSIDVWDDLKRLFPNNKNGSRIMVTTRLSNVAVSLGSRSPYMMEFLDESTSWNLFCEKVFSRQGCPFPELEKIGKYITKYCRGLPLAIVAIGGLLANSKMTREDWEFVAENVSSYAN
ncbi:UNVERIFIED_CONTAM: Disease resistance RPP8-like protein 3 [Sesamum angustifolium]|uniref:Disease resistance RPP8-like protein 3 n=1 Tax=Sesamum angustifolium TaxID=2727405 RepID=A0AAW2LJL3_9LAMI